MKQSDIYKIHQKLSHGVNKSRTLEICWTHSLIVRTIADQIAEKLEKEFGITIDKKLMEIGALIHDVGYYDCFDDNGKKIKDYVLHGRMGYEILLKMGVSKKRARFALTHVGVGFEKDIPIIMQSEDIEFNDEVYASKYENVFDESSNWIPIGENTKIVGNFEGNGHEIKILNSRHPVVEKVLKGEEYVPNDIVMDNNTDILLITGPNMAGKSTYMRQLGIIAIMAQIGCFVPASEATLPVFDKIFTRIGASDDLVSGESTFMVEMMEASRAIKYATRNSLILFDELGRGTATFDGMSLAQAILEYIANKIKCKTLFSTHYHELTDMEKTISNLKNKHVSAIEEDGNITFLHKVKDGSVDKSYGINVAKLAGLPEEVIDRASGILKIYENKEKKTDTIIQTTLPLNFEEKKSEVEEDIKNIDILNITPIEAINFLSKLKEKIK